MSRLLLLVALLPAACLEWPEELLCPEPCVNGCSGDTCELDCDGGCTCPRGWKCTVTCGARNSCAGKIDCTAGSACTISCSGRGSCSGGIDCPKDGDCKLTCGEDACSRKTTCGAGFCEVDCSAFSACRGEIDCSASCGCSVRGSRGKLTCPPACAAGCTPLHPCDNCP
jgi:hypothetical protein